MGLCGGTLNSFKNTATANKSYRSWAVVVATVRSRVLILSSSFFSNSGSLSLNRATLFGRAPWAFSIHVELAKDSKRNAYMSALLTFKITPLDYLEQTGLVVGHGLVTRCLSAFGLSLSIGN